MSVRLAAVFALQAILRSLIKLPSCAGEKHVLSDMTRTLSGNWGVDHSQQRLCKTAEIRDDWKDGSHCHFARVLLPQVKSESDLSYLVEMVE